jgi:hypothetical protein
MSGLFPAITRESRTHSKTEQGGRNPQNPANPAAAVVTDIARIRTFLTRADPAVLAVALVQLAEERPRDDVLLVALALAADAAELRRPSLRDDYAGGRYHRQNPLPEHSDLQRRRYPPTGNRELWIKYGPAGPPVEIGGVA